jgi:hypothetical protein
VDVEQQDRAGGLEQDETMPLTVGVVKAPQVWVISRKP